MCAGTPNALQLEMASGNWTNQITVTITFSTAVCGPINFH